MTRVPPSSALGGLTVLDMTQARAGPICVRQPLTLSRTPTDGWTALSDYGGDTEEVLAEFGFSEDERAALKQAGVVAGGES